MAEKKRTSKENSVRLVGYLKEDNLELITNKKGDKVIRGSLTVSTDEKGTQSHRVQFYVSENMRNGEHSKDYDALSELLPEKTVTVASYLEDNPVADFNQASNASTKVWVVARLEEYAYRLGEREDSMITLKGFRAGIKKATDKSPFKPGASFIIDAYIESIDPEKDESGNDTGRLTVGAIYLDYKGTAHRIPFVAPVEDGIASYIKDNYKIGTTVNLQGDLISLMIRDIDEDAEADHFGRGNTPQYKTVFVRERRIMGGSKTPLMEGQEGAYSKKAIMDGLTARDILMDENGRKRGNRSMGNSGGSNFTDSASAPTAPKPSPKTFGTDASDLDF